MEELLKRALGHGIELKCEFPSALPPVLVGCQSARAGAAQPGAERARRHAGRRRLTITAAAETKRSDGDGPHLRPGDYVRISIADTGIGMDEATLAKATEPFFTTKGPGKGTGLGLSMVHGLAAQSGGLLRIDSAPNGGTTVDLWLPRAKACRGLGDRNAERREAPAAAPSPARCSSSMTTCWS